MDEYLYIQYPVFGIAASDEDLDTIRTTLKKKGIEFEDISEDDDVRFRMIHYQAELCQHPLFVHIEFPERAGAFLDFMERIADLASLCYFNYTYTGERVGRALVGMEFESAEDRETVRKRMAGFSRNIIRTGRNLDGDSRRNAALHPQLIPERRSTRGAGVPRAVLRLRDSKSWISISGLRLCNERDRAYQE